MYVFYLEGRIKPYVRMTQKGKWTDEQAQEYLISKQHLQWQFKHQMQQHGWAMISSGIPLGINLVIHPARHNSDTTNILKAIEDAGNGIIYKDDRWVDYIEVSRSNTYPEDIATLTVFVIAKEEIQ